jgi:hypothetical protein
VATDQGEAQMHSAREHSLRRHARRSQAGMADETQVRF